MQPFANSSDAASQRPSSSQAPPTNTQSAGPPPKPAHTADVKPRLTKEQHDILERHFQAHHKPSTSTKKGFAENLGVPLDKINVKQDLKKQMNQYQMSMGMYPQPQAPVTMAQFPQQAPPQLSLAPGFYPVNADISPASLPVQSVEGPSHLDLGQQLMLQPQYDMHHSLRSIPEADRATSYHPNAVMNSIMAATAGAPYMQNNAVSMQQQNSNFMYETEPTNGLPSDVQFSMATTTPDVTDSSDDQFGGFREYLQYMPLIAPGPSDVGGNLSADDSPYSGAHSNGTNQSSNEPNAGSVASITSIFSGWTDENGSADVKPVHDSEDVFDSPYNMPQASASEAALRFWGPNAQSQGFSRVDMYQQSNASAHAVLSSPHQSERKVSAGPSDLEVPHFGDDIYTRRNSSTSNLASNIEAIHIQNTTPEGFKSPTQSSIAARRQKRPTALNQNTLRSASYSGSIPSPGNNGDHTLRRIRSSGISNAGRVQKPNPGSAKHSPMSLTFSEAASSPKFQRTLSSSSVTTVGQGGSLAPLTPQTPNETARFPYWQSNTVFRNHQPLPDHSSPESLSANWSLDSTAGAFVSGESPPSGTLETAQLHQARLGNDGLYRDTPPQSAPATQQAFPRTSLMQPPRLRAAFHSSADLTLAHPKPSHIRRPSLPVDAPGQGDEANMQYAAPTYNDFRGANDFNYDDFKDFPLSSIQHNVPFAPPVSALPDFLVHHYSPPVDGVHGHMRRTTEPQAKNYIFANQGPRDFRS
ncbi:hypothetical protein N0V90_003943 [Kalmusia sp. IMI 367209]|nr:hypothetical protein N0V90_003943 [Kalmusia sp. IMI 367209]